MSVTDQEVEAVETEASATASEALASTEGDGDNKRTPKSKEELGIDPSMVITWIPFAQPKERNELVRRVARARSAGSDEKTSVASVLLSLLTTAITPEVVAAWETEAANAPEPKAKSTEKIPDDPEEAAKFLEEKQSKLEKRMANAQKAVENAQKALAAAKAKAAGRAPVATADDDADGATA